MNFKKGDEISLKIVDLAFGGVGIGKYTMPDGSGEIVVFVEKVVPGDEVLVSLTRIKKQFLEARLIKIVNPSPERIAGRCKHFGVCGGCRWQFLDYKNQLKWKEKIVRDSLERIGEIANPPVEKIIGMKSPWFYRNKMEYSFGADANGLKLGFHPAKNFRDVFDLSECFLESEVSAQIAVKVKEWAVSRKITAYDPRVNEGILRNLIVREGKNTNEIMVNLFTNGKDFAQHNDFKRLILENFPGVTSLYRTSVTIKRGNKTKVEEFHLEGNKTITETLKVAMEGGKDVTLKFDISPSAFFQPNTIGAQILYETVLNFANPTGTETVYDLFCGTGTIGMFLASGVKNVVGIELNESAVQSAKVNAVQNSIKNMEFICGDVDEMLPKLKGKADIIITDPPRSGIFPKTLQKILELKPAKWIYVSCNPTTRAGDLKEAIKAGYKLKRAQPVDMFPHTYHIETVCELTL